MSPETLERLKDHISRTGAPLVKACAAIGINYGTLMYHLLRKPALKEELLAIRAEASKPLISIKFDGTLFEKFLKITREKKLTISAACQEIGGIQPWQVSEYFTPEQRALLKACRGKTPVPSTMPSQPLSAISIHIPSAPPVEPVTSFNGVIFPPKLIYRWIKNFMGKYSSHRGRFFIRVEADHYYVVGYEYQLSTDAGYVVDPFLHDFNTDLQSALNRLQKKLTQAMDKEIVDEAFGKVMYCKEQAPGYDPKIIVCKGIINVPDGEYLCKVSRDLGQLIYEKTLYQFALPETLPVTAGVRIVVKDKIGTIHL